MCESYKIRNMLQWRGVHWKKSNMSLGRRNPEKSKMSLDRRNLEKIKDEFWVGEILKMKNFEIHSYYDLRYRLFEIFSDTSAPKIQIILKYNVCVDHIK